MFGKACAKHLLFRNGSLAGKAGRIGPGHNILSFGEVFVWRRPRHLPGEAAAKWIFSALWEGVQKWRDNIFLQVSTRSIIVNILLLGNAEKIDLIKLLLVLDVLLLHSLFVQH